VDPEPPEPNSENRSTTVTTNLAAKLTGNATIAAIYEAFGRGDVPAILDHLADDVTWDGEWAPLSATSLPPTVGPGRRMAVVRQPLADLVRTGHALDMTVNDLLLAAGAQLIPASRHGSGAA
jgi:hypothetical protein